MTQLIHTALYYADGSGAAGCVHFNSDLERTKDISKHTCQHIYPHSFHRRASRKVLCDETGGVESSRPDDPAPLVRLKAVGHADTQATACTHVDCRGKAVGMLTNIEGV